MELNKYCWSYDIVQKVTGRGTFKVCTLVSINMMTNVKIVLGFLYLVANSAVVISQDHGELNDSLSTDENFDEGQYKIMIFEDTKPGTVVFSPKASVKNQHVHLSDAGDAKYQIQDGNEYGRFRIVQTSGDIILAGYLDYNIDHTYELYISSFPTVNISQGKGNTSYTLVVIVVDVAKWPPVYNKTCETRPHEHTDWANFPSDAIVSPYWFRQKARKGHYSLLQADIDNIDTSKQFFVSTCSLYFQNEQVIAKELDIRVLGCPSGMYGFKCDKMCICQNGASCHVFNGACQCPTGWFGPACDMRKPSIVVSPKREVANYGSIVMLLCEIENIKTDNKSAITWYFNGHKVDESDGSTIILGEQRYTSYSQLQIKSMVDVLAGYYTCQVQDVHGNVYIDSSEVNVKCFDGTYGRTCQSSCSCHPQTSISCDRYLGCICKYGWNGTHCQIDDIQPSINSCPSDITQYVDRDTDFATVIWIEPESFDNSENLTITSSHQPMDTFGIGITLVTYTAVDGSNNMASCEFNVHVLAKPIDGRKVGGLAVFVFIILVPVFVYIGYKYRLKIYLAFSLPVEEYDDNEKECDAFVTYSSRDEDFVDDVLTDLERDDRYRLFLHQRDFKGGLSIFHNIEEALDNSRCTILVLSPAFIESKWCQFETMAAMRKLVDNGQRLIPIMKEDVMHLELPPLMKRILDSVTCIKWTQNGTEKQKNKFWNELESAVRKRRKHPDRGYARRIMIALRRRMLFCDKFRYNKLNNHEYEV
ncbi:uncharacterized protein [Ptychodera flava]|uniref:uncharacterized protein isoform X2 n=1 Tax=Ptychodera flava TaxID=63121 RepID=UPI00396A1F1E